jgi:hypothetical protein
MHSILLYALLVCLIYPAYSFAPSRFKSASLKTNPSNSRSRHRSDSLQMITRASADVINFLSNPSLKLLPLCLVPTSKTTTINDPTAGMTPEQINNYLNNVGGGLCGYPEYVRDAVGVAININFAIFTVLSLTYFVMSAVKFFVERDLDEIAKPYEKVFFPNSPSPPGKALFASNQDEMNRVSVLPSSSGPTPSDGLNRSQRRMKQKFGDRKDKAQ